MRYLLAACVLAASWPVNFSLSVLILHPVYAGSHVLTLQAIAANLLQAGHQVS